MIWRRCTAESLEARLPLSAAPTTISVAVSATHAVYGQAVTLTATVAASPTAPSEGNVTFMENGNVVGASPVSSGTATLNGVKLNAGADAITASYSDPSNNFAASATSAQATSLIKTVAGDGNWGYAGDGGGGASAKVNYPRAVAVDAAGDIFIADTDNNVVRKVDHATGRISTVAGNGTAGFTGDGGAATSAELDHPSGIAVDSSGNLFIADTFNSVVREVNQSTGIITTVAGNHAAGPGYSGDGGAATAAQLHNPYGIVVDSAGNLFIADYINNVVREVSHSTGVIATVAGNGTAGFSGDGGAAAAAELNSPYSIAVDSSGNLFIADAQNNRIREVVWATGNIITVAGNGTAGFSGDGGAATVAELDGPAGIAVDSTGNLFIGDAHNNRIREVVRGTGNIITVAGNGTGGFAGDGGAASSAEIYGPAGVAVDANGNLFFADNDNQRVREVANGASVLVTPASLTVTADNQTMRYGAVLPSFTASYSGFVNGDSSASLGTQPILATTATSGSPTGSYVITVGGAVDPNYTIAYSNGVLTVIPAPVDDVYTIGSGTITVAAGDGLLANDAPSGALSVNAGTATGTAGGAFTFHADGSFVYAPSASFAGYDRARYAVSDGLGDTNTATVTVVSHAGGVVWKFYESVLGRNPDDAGLRHWIADLAQGGSTGDMAVAFAESDELLDRNIVGYYQQYLGREADLAGLDAWKSVWRLTGGREIVEANIAASAEFFHNAGDTTSGWLTAIYERVLNRTPDAQGFNYWIERLDSGMTEVEVVLAFFESPEAFSEDVTMWFEQDFHVKPSAEQLVFYVGQMLAGGSDAAIQQELASAPAYSATVPTAATGTAVRLPDYLTHPIS